MPRLIESILVSLCLTLLYSEGFNVLKQDFPTGIDVYCLSVISRFENRGLKNFCPQRADRCLVACLPVCQRTILLCLRLCSSERHFRKRVQRYCLFPKWQHFTHFFFQENHFFSPTLLISLYYNACAQGNTTDFQQQNNYILYGPRLYTLCPETIYSMGWEYIVTWFTYFTYSTNYFRFLLVDGHIKRKWLRSPQDSLLVHSGESIKTPGRNDRFTRVKWSIHPSAILTGCSQPI